MRRWLEDEELLSRHHISANFPRLKSSEWSAVPTSDCPSFVTSTRNKSLKKKRIRFKLWLTNLSTPLLWRKWERNVPSHIKVSTRIIIYNRDYSITTWSNTLPDFFREYKFGLKGMNKGTSMMEYGTMTLLWQPYFCSSWGKGHIFLVNKVYDLTYSCCCL